MYIKSITIKKHKILGTIYLDTENAQRQKTDEGEDSQDSISVHMEEDETNHYTFIIGKNGTGKTTLFQNLIYYFYIRVPKLSASVARTMFRLSNFFEDGLKMIKPLPSESFVAENKKLRVLHISNDKTCIGERMNSSFSEINPSTRDVSVRMLPLIRENNYNIDALWSILGKKNPDTKQTFSLGDVIDAYNWGNLDTSRFILLNGTSSINLLGFMEFVDMIVKGAERINEEEIESYKEYWSFIEHSCLNESLDEVIIVDKLQQLFSGSKLIKRLGSFLAFKDEVLENSYEADSLIMLNIKDYDIAQQELELEFKDLTDADITLIRILSEMKILEYHITLDGVSIDDMSSGERAMMMFFSALAPYVKESPENIIIFIDEPENSLHPQWQQQYPFLIHSLIEDIYKIKSSHIIINTHSPLIIQKTFGDIPNVNMKVFNIERENGNFSLKEIPDCNRYCLEELMMDQFGVGYRGNYLEEKIIPYLETEGQKDPAKAIFKTDVLKSEIDELFKLTLEK